jgi:hypothetical protein
MENFFPFSEKSFPNDNESDARFARKFVPFFRQFNPINSGDRGRIINCSRYQPWAKEALLYGSALVRRLAEALSTF